MFQTLTQPQRHFTQSPVPFPAFVGGFGSGKTFAAVLRVIALKSRSVGQNVAYYLPTYDLVNLIAKPRVTEVLTEMGVSFKSSTSEQIIIPEWQGSIIFRNMDNPNRIVGYEVAHSIVDELDTMPKDKAAQAWNKIIARNRQRSAPYVTDASGLPVPYEEGSPIPPGCVMHAPNSVAVATTPEGFAFVYERWVKKADARYRIYRARTLDNVANLPKGYIENLRATYNEQELEAYLNGQFVNLKSGCVYHEFDRTKNACITTIQPGEPLHVGMDFNVGEMAAVVFVMRETIRIDRDLNRTVMVDPHAVAEHVKIRDTPAMIDLLRQRYPGHQLHIYPDASSQGRHSSDASQSDLTLLYQGRTEAGGFIVHVNPTNPRVKDRVLAKNRMIHNQGIRRMMVNIDACPVYTEALEQQSYTANGDPDKTSGHDHVNDAGGYVMAERYPIAGREMHITQMGGI